MRLATTWDLVNDFLRSGPRATLAGFERPEQMYELRVVPLTISAAADSLR